MAIQWGGVSGHLQVGIEVNTDGYDTNTPSINVYVDFYVQTVAWGFADNMTLATSGSGMGPVFSFRVSSGKGQTVLMHVGRVIIYGQGQNYNGGPAYAFAGQVSGNTQGGQPRMDVGWSLPPRPPNYPTNPPMGVDSIGSNSARVVVLPADPRGSGIVAYQVLVGTVNSIQGVIDTQVANFGGGTGTVSNLRPSRAYYAIARALNGVGYSAWSGPVYFGTLSNRWLKVGGTWMRLACRVKVAGEWRGFYVYKKVGGVWRE